MNDLVSLFLAILLLGANAFFVGAEFALISARRDRLEALVESGQPRARTVMLAGERMSLMLAAAQLGITVCSLGLGALGEPVIASQLERLLHPFGVPGAVVHPLAFVVALAIFSVLHVVLGEMVPKNIAIAGPERTALLLVPVLVGFVRLVRPVISLLNVCANGVLRVVGVRPKDELDTAYTRDELAEMLGESRREGLLDEPEHRRLAQALSSADRTVADVLVPIDQVRTVPERPTVGDVATAVSTTGFSRFPLRRADGRLVGYLHVKDVLELAGADPATPVPRSRVRGLPDLPADARLDEALSALRRARSHLARAVGEDGALLGVVALEDLVEEFVGTVRDGTHVNGAAR
ncbi:hemolysin family protein [Streptoalloteichus hindustanus]|uniref:Hemolysin, contains CBS domains n=1 Tax=Streptoalloteichus hindustanus TaxID=2017 RepID=A0A1M5LT52_STRHI|nr:hemolysin family protein [Streptoalloteichus hindustanus]SHG68175.1 Hemolysin, contains CBS domains [Streptoalloteichus hindustanus]